MILPEMQAQFTLERTNEQFYRALAAAADVVNRPGASAYFEKAANDEQSHAKRVRDYIVDRNGTPVFDPIEAIPGVDGNSYIGMFNMALTREQITTSSVNEKYQMAETDTQTQAFLISSQGDWPGFIQEQTDSERELTDFILKIDRLGPDGIEIFDNSLLETYGG
jgi:ferritin